MDDAPERIRIDSSGNPLPLTMEGEVDMRFWQRPVEGPTEYVRADLHDAALARAEAEVVRLRELIRVYVEEGPPRSLTGQGKCPHGQWDYDECVQCTSEWFILGLSGGSAEPSPPEPTGQGA